MTITVSVLIPGAIVLAADSRQVAKSPFGQLRVDSDNTQKIFQLGSNLAASVHGQGLFYLSSSESPRSIKMIFRSAAKHLSPGCSVAEATTIVHQRVAECVEQHCDVVETTQARVAFHVAGYDRNSEIGELYMCQIPGKVSLERKTTDAGAVWSGQREIISRLILGYDPRLFEFLVFPKGRARDSDEERWHSESSYGFGAAVRQLFGLRKPKSKNAAVPHHRQTRSNETSLKAELSKLQLHLNFQTMVLQDAVDLAAFLVQATVQLQRLSDGIVGAPGQFPTCGGKVEVAVLTPEEGFRWLQHEQLKVESASWLGPRVA
jgi:hypothetical protein